MFCSGLSILSGPDKVLFSFAAVLTTTPGYDAFFFLLCSICTGFQLQKPDNPSVGLAPWSPSVDQISRPSELTGWALTRTSECNSIWRHSSYHYECSLPVLIHPRVNWKMWLLFSFFSLLLITLSQAEPHMESFSRLAESKNSRSLLDKKHEMSPYCSHWRGTVREV